MKQASVVFDSFAILSFLQDEPGSERVKERLIQVQSKRAAGYISAVNLCEVYYIVTREKEYTDAEVLTASLRDWGLNIIPADEDMARRAAWFKARYPIALADAFAAAAAQKLEASLLTGDPEFHSLEGNIEIEWIAR